MRVIFKSVKISLAFLGLLPIYFYRTAIRPVVPHACHFYPSCSAYAIIAIKRHGIIRGWGLAIWRIARCNPFNRRAHGYDPVGFGFNGGAKWVI